MELPSDSAKLVRELAEARQQQAATSEILRVISGSPSDIQPVVDTIARSALRLCNGHLSAVYRFDGKLIHCIAQHNWTNEGLEALGRIYPRPPSRETQAAKAILDRMVVHVPDMDDREVPQQSLTLARALGYRSILVVPILREGESVGAIAVARAEAGPFSDSQIELLKTFADQALIAIENVRLFKAEQQRTRELSELLDQQTATSEVLRIISSSPGELEPVFETALQNAVRICGAKFGNLFLREGDAFRIGATHGTPPAYVDYLRRERVFHTDPRSGLGQMARTKQPFHIADITVEPTHAEKLRIATIELAGARTLIGVPMLKHGEVIGCIAIYRQEVRPFTDKQIALVQNFAAQAVIAIENTRLLNELRESLQQQTATADILTVISNSLDDTQPVFDAIVQSGLKLFADATIQLSLADGDKIRLAAVADRDPARADAMRRIFPVPLTREYMNGVAILDGRVVDVPDAENAPPELAIGARNFLATGNRAVTIMSR